MNSDFEDFKKTLEKAIDKKPGICIQCRRPFSINNVFTEAGWREVHISGICEKCFDVMFSEEDD